MNTSATQASIRFRPVIRVFVSSTFSDLKEERNALQCEVFPRLEQYCLICGFQFQAIDLRWGVPGEAGRDHRTMQICFDELRRAQEVSPRPNFLVLLGDRYGWQPLAEEVAETEFLELEKAASQLDEEASRDKQAAESATQLLRTWYRRDENADPVVFLLRSRHEWPDGQQSTNQREDEEWKKVEAVLWAVINRAYPPSGLAGRFEHVPKPDEPLPPIVKFQASATEQEIWRGALAVADAPDRVVAWYRTIRNRAECLGDERAKDFFDKDLTLHRAATELRKELSRKLRKEGEGEITPVEVDLHPSEDGTKLAVTLDHLATMCNDIEARLVHIIEKEMEEYWHPTIGGVEPQAHMKATGPSEARKLELEQQAHEQFGESRAPEGRFVGREKELEAIARYLGDENDRQPMVVYGPSGTGKTALLARAAQSAAGPGRRIFVRFLGTTPQSSNLRSLLANLCRALRDPDAVEQDVPTDLNKLQEEFDRLLALATPDRSILLFLDALDQLDEADGARQTYWLRTPLPPHVKVVISCIYDIEGAEALNEPYRALERRRLIDRPIAVESLPGPEAMELLDRWLARPDPRSKSTRKITSQQRNIIQTRIAPDGAAACRRPLYLRILFEECRLWPSYKKVSPADLGPNTAELLQHMFDRLEQPAVHGRIVVDSALGYIACARRGLSENEILEILWSDPDYKKHLDEQSRQTGHEFPLQATRIPVAIWSRLRHDLDPYLVEHAAPGGAVLNFYHREVERVVKDRFLRQSAQKILRHGRLAAYFQSNLQPWWRQTDASRQLADNTAAKRFSNARRASELPWQLLRVADASDPYREQFAAWDAPLAVLCDLDFVEVKCSAGLVFELQEDYGDARKALPEAQAELRAEEARNAEIERWTKEITEYARQWSERRDRIARGEHVDRAEPVLPKAPSTCRMWTDDEIEAECRRIREAPTRFDRLTAFAGFVEGECYPLLEFGGHDGFTFQHAFNYAPGGPVRDAATGLLPPCAATVLLRRWPKAATWNQKPAMLRTLEGHAGPVWSVTATPDGRRGVSGGEDNTLRVWDLETGQCLRTLTLGRGRKAGVPATQGLSVTPDGHRAVSESGEFSLRVWDLESGACLRTLAGHSRVLCVGVTPDGHRAVLGTEDELLLWDLESGACLRTLAGHSGSVQSVSVTPDGRRAVSGGEDKTVRVWDLESGACLQTLEGHSGLVFGVSVTPDGRRAVSAGGRLWVWDLESGTCLRTFEGHRATVVSVSVTPDGRRVVSGNMHGTVRVWDLESGAPLRTLEGHGGPVWSVSVMPDSRRAVTGNWDNMLRIWDLESGRGERGMEGQWLGGTEAASSVKSVSVAPDGQRAVTGSLDGTVRVWDLESGACLHTLQGYSGPVESVGMTPDGRCVVSGDNTLRVWDLESGTCLATLEGHSDRITSISVTPDGRRAVSGSRDKTLRVWESGVCLHVLEGHSGWVHCVSVTPDGRRAVSASGDDTLRVWDLESGACLHTLEGHRGLVTSLSVTPDGRRAVSGSGDYTLRVWDLESGACLQVLEAHRKPNLRVFSAYESVRVTPGGRRAVSSGGPGGALRVWDLQSGACLHTLEGHREVDTIVRVTPDGRRAVSGSHDKTVRLWDLESGACLAVLLAAAPVTAVAIFSRLLVIGTSAGQVLFVEMHNLPRETAVETENSDAAYEDLLRRGLDSSRREKGPEHEETLAYGTALASLLERMGRTDEARALRETRNTLERGNEQTEQRAVLSTAIDLNNAALELRKQGRLSEAERLLRQALAIDEWDRGVTHPKIPHRLNNLCTVLIPQGKLAEAKSLLARAWQLKRCQHDLTSTRLLFMRSAVALLESQPLEVYVGQLKCLLALGSIPDYAEVAKVWDITCFIEFLRPRIPADAGEFLIALVLAMNDPTKLADLDRFPEWRNQPPTPLDALWPDGEKRR